MPRAVTRRKWRRVSPQKKMAATDAIFDQITQVNKNADADADTLRISMDAKATVKVGDFSRGGKNRVPTQAADHDFHPEALITPVGILLPAQDELFICGVMSRVTSDCLADYVARWRERVKHRFAHVKVLVVNLDNGLENHTGAHNSCSAWSIWRGRRD
jgi:hypothetical protein